MVVLISDISKNDMKSFKGFLVFFFFWVGHLYHFLITFPGMVTYQITYIYVSFILLISSTGKISNS